MQITTDLQDSTITALLDAKTRYTGSEAAFAKMHGINGSVYSRLKNGDRDGLLSPTKWMSLARQLGVHTRGRKWNTVHTEVYAAIQQEISFCQEHAKGRLFVDHCGIGKSHAARDLSRRLPNNFYIDAGQSATNSEFIRNLAHTIGLDTAGRLRDVLANIKYTLNYIPKPHITIDEAADLPGPAISTLKAIMNATEGRCGWFVMGAEGLQEKMERGIRHRTPGFRELFDRLSVKFSSVVPLGKEEQREFYVRLISDVLRQNMTELEQKSLLNSIVHRCLVPDPTGRLGGLRRAESLLILEREEREAA